MNVPYGQNSGNGGYSGPRAPRPTGHIPPTQNPPPRYGALPAQVPTPPSANPPDNYLILAVIATLFCCLPLGFVGIVKANQVNTLWAQGRFAAAEEAAKSAKAFTFWAFAAGVSLSVLFGIYYVITLAPPV